MSFPTDSILSLLGAHPYLLLFPLVFVEGPVVTVCAGFLVATGLMSVGPTFALAVAADLSGDTFYYAVGRSGRKGRISRVLARLGLTQKRLAKLEGILHRNGPKALVGAKLLDSAAVPVFIAAGLARMSYRRFMAWNLAVALPKSAALMALGFFFGWRVEEYLGFGSALAGLVVISVILLFTVSKLSKRRSSKEDE